MDVKNQSGDFDVMMANITVVEAPVKAGAETQVTQEELETQAQHARDSLEIVDYSKVRGTCSDERVRIGLLNGQPVIEARPSVYGATNVNGLYLAEFSGFFGNDENRSGVDSLRQVTERLNRNGLKSGGHRSCAANEKFRAVIGLVADPENYAVLDAYAQQELGDEYDQTAADTAHQFAVMAVESGRYDGWDGSELETVLGDEAGEAIEILVDEPHEGKTVIKTKGQVEGKGLTISQTKLHDVAGEDSFVIDEGYQAAIINALASGPEADRMRVVMEHAAQLLNKAIYLALPNEELHQINLTV